MSDTASCDFTWAKSNRSTYPFWWCDGPQKFTKYFATHIRVEHALTSFTFLYTNDTCRIRRWRHWGTISYERPNKCIQRLELTLFFWLYFATATEYQVHDLNAERNRFIKIEINTTAFLYIGGVTLWWVVVGAY